MKRSNSSSEEQGFPQKKANYNKVKEGTNIKEDTYHKEEIIEKLSEKAYGNYNAYYTLVFHVNIQLKANKICKRARRLPKAKCNIDPRIDLLDSALFKDKCVLDIGCNSGNITVALGKHINTAEINTTHYYII